MQINTRKKHWKYIFLKTKYKQKKNIEKMKNRQQKKILQKNLIYDEL